MIAIIAVLIALLLPGRPGGPRGGPADPVRQQPQAARPGPAQLREQQRLLPPRRRVDQLRRHCSPPATQFVDGNYSTLARLLQYLEGTTIYNTINFNYEYNNSSLGNVTAFFTASLNVFLCPSAVRQPGGGKDGARRHRHRRRASAAVGGYGVRRLRPDRLHRHQPDRRHRRHRLDRRTPYRDKTTRAERPAQAGQDLASPSAPTAPATRSPSPRMPAATPAYQSPYTRGVGRPPHVGPEPKRLQPGRPGLPLRYWRWAEADDAFGVSGQINNIYPTPYCTSAWQPSCTDPKAWPSRATTPGPTTRSSPSTPAGPTASSATAASSSSRPRPTSSSSGAS